MAGTGSLKREIERLIAGEVVLKKIRQELTYRDLYRSVDNVWNILFMTGYLTQRGKPSNGFYQLVIPNLEIRKIFTEQIMDMFREEIQKDGETVNLFCEALQSGNADDVEKPFVEYLKRTISIWDTFVWKRLKENFYHGILLGILGFKDSWVVFSNRESGEGYNDIQVEIDDEGGLCVICENSDEGVF